jgi:hypothetical protein
MKNIVEICTGCLKITDERCSVYASPAVWERKGGCPMKTNKVLEVKKDKKINPIKASKRAKRGR